MPHVHSRGRWVHRQAELIACCHHSGVVTRGPEEPEYTPDSDPEEVFEDLCGDGPPTSATVRARRRGAMYIYICTTQSAAFSDTGTRWLARLSTISRANKNGLQQAR
jgi:hypothetical protein